MKSPAMIVALIALFVALGGSAVAASGLISGSQIKNGTIPASKLTPTALKLLHGRPGPEGPEGPAGPVGPQGNNGGFDPSSVQIVQSADTTILAGAVGSAVANCPSGTTVIGGGGVNVGVGLWQDAPDGNGWIAGGESYDFISGYVRAYAVCASP